jgi:hypothetical protein
MYIYIYTSPLDNNRDLGRLKWYNVLAGHFLFKEKKVIVFVSVSCVYSRGSIEYHGNGLSYLRLVMKEI